MSLPVSDNKYVGLFYFKAGCLLFWASWFGIACFTNYFDFLYTLGLLPSSWLFRSGNYALLDSALSIYHSRPLLTHVLFICNMSVQGLSSLLFLTAFLKFIRRQPAWALINTAFSLSIALWATLLIVAELFIAYAFEFEISTLFIFELITLLAIHLLPSQE